EHMPSLAEFHLFNLEARLSTFNQQPSTQYRARLYGHDLPEAVPLGINMHCPIIALDTPTFVYPVRSCEGDHYASGSIDPHFKRMGIERIDLKFPRVNIRYELGTVVPVEGIAEYAVLGHQHVQQSSIAANQGVYPLVVDLLEDMLGFDRSARPSATWPAH